ncbi:hypothetical protein T8S45_09530 [Blastomonas marina]|uniref:hypothetical protein n=1 Tax=Blastomonas marina TaxID=1867408 RepID=UPI002AC9A894|nr:hypothetical protein [Blastomonas marina]WPZ03082.1 hypothetical protein T8S45_09530 [Blastomonas marina]
MRKRNSPLPGYDGHTLPTQSECFFDRLQIQLAGDWSSGGLAFSEWVNSLGSPALFGDGHYWLNGPEFGTGLQPVTAKIEGRKRTNCLIRDLKIDLKQRAEGRGNLYVRANINPSRIFAHRLHGLPDVDSNQPYGFERCRRLDPTDFFSSHMDVGSSLDGNDNWIDDLGRADRIFGSDFRLTFPVVLIEQFQRILSLIFGDGSLQTEGVRQVMCVNGGQVAIDWGSVRVPQIETYFERYRPSARLMVRRGGAFMIASDHSSEARYFSNDVTLRREGRAVRVLTDLPTKKKLAVYAKSNDRIRFEVKRLTKGNYRNVDSGAEVSTRFLGILDNERSELLDKVRWNEVFEAFSGPDSYGHFDLGSLISNVGAAFGNEQSEIGRVLLLLLTDGSIGQDDAPPEVLRELERRGIIERNRPRVRDLNGAPAIYGLCPPYRDMVNDLTQRDATISATNADQHQQ